MDDLVLAVDIGGTKTAVAVADGRSGIVLSVEAPTPGGAGPEAVLATVTRLAAAVLDQAGIDIVHGIGVATAGVVDSDAGLIVSATDTLAGWAGTPVAALLRHALGRRLAEGAPVLVLNDVNAHAIGEQRFGAAAGAASALVVAVGTGVGAGIIIDGRPRSGAHHVAGELAHVPIPGAEGFRCPCGRDGHLEAIGSGVGLHRVYLARGGDPRVSDARDVAALAVAGDQAARAAIAESATAVGVAIAGAVTLIDPDRVVITGGVPDIGDLWWAPMRARYRAEAIDALVDVPLVPGELGAQAPLRGAAAAVWERRGVHA